MNTSHALDTQLSLFDRGAPDYDPRLRGIRRDDLGAGAWVEHLPQWLAGHGRVFRDLAANAGWVHQRRTMYDREVDVPRLTAGLPSEGAAPRLLRRMSVALTLHYGRALDRISLSYYRDGRDSVAPHGDKVGEFCVDDTIIAILSVGTPRRFLMRAVAGGDSRAFSLGWGDLLVMGGNCQRTWVHGVPKAAQAGPRISVMFREHPPLAQ